MFDFNSASHVIQLTTALCAGIVIFVLSYIGLHKQLLIALIVIIPFQVIASKYGSLNMAITYVIGGGMLLKSFIKQSKSSIKLPLIFSYLFILFAYLISWTHNSPAFFMKNLIYLIMLGSNIVLFYMVYSIISKKRYNRIVSGFNRSQCISYTLLCCAILYWRKQLCPLWNTRIQNKIKSN